MALSIQPASIYKARLPVSTTEMISECQKAAKLKRWDVAIKLASTALQECGGMPNQDRVTILDTRVALYLRMNEFDLAIKDAKAMIRLDRKDGRGYIRCGHIERARGDLSAASNFYRHGLKQVPTSSHYIHSITKEMSAVQEQIRIETMTSKPVNPMEVLPLEVVQHILSFISYKQHVLLLRVCRAWNRLLRSLRPLIDTLAFPGASKDITPQMLLAALRRLEVPTAVSATRLNDAACSILVNRLQNSPDFQSLSILEVQSKWISPISLPLHKYNLKSVAFGSSTEMILENLFEIFSKCPGLETARFDTVIAFSIGRPRTVADGCLESKILKHLHIDAGRENIDMTRLFTRLPALRSLSFSGIFGMSRSLAHSQNILDLRYMVGLETLKIFTSTIPRLHLPASLKDLDISQSVCISDEYLTEPNPTTLPNLERLRIWKCRPPPTSIFSNSRSTNLETLSELSMTIDQGSKPMFTTLMESGWLAGVRRLRLAGSAFDNSYCDKLPQCLRSLEDLSLKETMINGAFVADLLMAKNCSNRLKKINLVDCPSVGSDIVPWAEARRIELRLSRSHMEPSGRRLRDAP
ncbi:hypothetical protein LTR10_019064 [Elasticomyces elasticus]|uniref:F-box domain-containing protein n=1 Tax=Exophiala sideris TaxID=1016849 RepID=A0ABR0IYT7_9EURO|nr:hypothetical protein LTR10_019064 [Elasticomyces elasticus]KAK5022949.1 hypothetical protein LTS07_009677 [Exophiala sideris]KAK5026372.1 hypothetical protein LTR13_009986 [Exophiala sideris]KAK5052306.1 hypothetical protein LTR69_009842 [Exophiala sideris]KAK5177334.1 hypothetical protein LTR44_010129 [Eurotiomycetes sp. CCFEE 6388]